MNKFYTLIFFSFFINFCFAQKILNKPEIKNRVISDKVSISLQPGFYFKANPNLSFRAYIATGNNSIRKSITKEEFDRRTKEEFDRRTKEESLTEQDNKPTNTEFHDTKGNINVGGQGQLQYSFPIALPPGVKKVAPQIYITYSSNSSNGFAGYGWNLEGITKIYRSGKNLEKDGVITGLELDYSDYYSFNGQRLILTSGEYGKDGATYKTEKFSNIFIKSVGEISRNNWEGPNYFEVIFDDGSKAWYGSTTKSDNPAITPIEYNIVKWEDTQGNYITYGYTQSDYVALINNISWGGNDNLKKPHFNSMKFGYKDRLFIESSYLKGKTEGIHLLQSKILNEISVEANGNIFKKYTLEHSTSKKLNGEELYPSYREPKIVGKDYEVVTSITEYNEKGEKANPVYFSYEKETNKTSEFKNIKDPLYQGKKGLYGDFDGDGETDLITNEGDNLYLYKKVFIENSNKISIGFIKNVKLNLTTTFTIKNSKNQVLPRKGFVILNQAKRTNKIQKADLTIRSYSLDPYNNQIKLEFEKILKGEEYDDSHPLRQEPGNNVRISESDIITGVNEFEINGYGLSELIVETSINRCVFYPHRLPPRIHGDRFGVPQNADDKINCSNSESHFSISLNHDEVKKYSIPLNKNFVISGDFNGDGRIDYLNIGNFDNFSTLLEDNSERGFSLKNYSFRMVNNQRVQGFKEAAVAGDFNGDGKTDLLIPKTKKTSDWLLYLSNGKGFESPQEINNFSCYSKEFINNPPPSGGRRSSFNSSNSCDNVLSGLYNSFIALDLDNDGKDELISVSSDINQTPLRTGSSISVFSTITGKDSKISFEKRKKFSKIFNSSIISFGLTSIKGENGNVLVYGKPQKNNYGLPKEKLFFINGISVVREMCGENACEDLVLLKIEELKDVSSLRRMNSITEGGIKTLINYKELDPIKNPNFYKGELMKYPYLGSERLPKTFVVSQLKQGNRKQDFFYQNLVMHLKGKGTIGFEKQARSSWYVDGFENTKIWSVNQMDPFHDGIAKKEWTVRVPNNDVNRIFTSDFTASNTDLISYQETEYLYNYFRPNGEVLTEYPSSPIPDLITAIVPNKITTLDPYKGINTVETITYNEFYLPTSVTKNVNDSFGITEISNSYLNNEDHSGKDYYIGRPLSRTIKTSAYGKTELSKEEYTYTNQLISSKKVYDKNQSEFITESYLYDGFGNMTQKSIKNSIDSATKLTKIEYDSQGKFITSTTDNLGLTEHYTYNNWGQLLTVKDAFGNTVTNTYDNWGKKLSSKNSLSGLTTYSYMRNAEGNIRITEQFPTGNYVSSFINNLGQKYKTLTKGFNANKLIIQETQYDALGRKIKESEPYYEGESVKWNTISYNDAVYPQETTSTSFIGKKVKTKITGLTISVVEENGYGRTTTKEQDALGNTIKTTDPGGTIEFAYDSNGKQISAKYDTNIVTTKYDHWGRKSEFHDPSNGLYKYYYNGFGDIIRVESPKGKKEFFYNSRGQLINQIESANDNSTAKTISYSYSPKGQLLKKEGSVKNAKSDLDAYSVINTYETNGRLSATKELSNGREFEQKNIVYNDKGLITSFTKQVKSNQTIIKANIENVYDTWSGELYQVKDKDTGAILWQLEEKKANSQVVKEKLGKTSIINSYDVNNMLTNISHVNESRANILKINYSFDAIKNELNSRETIGDFDIKETFVYDNNNRLKNWTNPVDGSMHFNVYDAKGRITDNNQIGKINFSHAGKIYQPISIDLNQKGNDYYKNELIQTISYNENNDPVFIDGVKGDASFSYGLSNMRQKVSYGGIFTQKTEGKFTKIYDETGSIEIIINNKTGEEKHILYIEGSPYESNIILVKDYDSSTAQYYFLQKDYIGSILAITDYDGNKIEQRHFDAWGNLTHLKQGDSDVITDASILAQTTLFLERGYTSHEHFQELGIIHMNGRLYDPLFRRFLNADENIQDPTNTQNYNKYGYVLNNPLLYNDPSGEFITLFPALSAFWGAIFTGAVVGAGIGLLSYTITTVVSGQEFNFGGALKSIMWGVFPVLLPQVLGMPFLLRLRQEWY